MEPLDFDESTLNALVENGHITPDTARAIRSRSPASIPAGDDPQSTSARKFGMSQETLDNINAIPTPPGQNSLTDPRGFTEPAKPGIWDTIKGAWDKQVASGFGIPSASASEPPRVPAAAPSPANPPRVDTSQLAIAQPKAQSANAAPPAFGQDFIKNMNDAYGQEASAIKGLTSAESDAAGKMADVYGRTQKQMEGIDKDVSGSYEALKTQTQKQMADIDELGKKISQAQQIDPNRYWHSMSTGQKVANMIAIALGGFGMGYAGKQGNPVMDQINRYVDLDIQAQKDNFDRLRGQMGDKINLYGLARQSGLDGINAKLAAKSAALQQAEMMVKEQMARSQAPEVVARGQKALADLNMQRTENNQRLAMSMWQMNAMREAATGGGIENPMFLPEDMQKKMVKMPNGKFRAASSEDGAKAVSAANLAGDEMKDLLGQMYKLQQSAGRSLPYSEAAAQAKGLMSKIIFKNQKLEGINRLSDTDVHLLQDQIGDPTSFMQGRATALLNQMYENVDREQEAVRKQYIPGYSPMRKEAK